MAPQPRTRTVPCDKCREKHLKCDGETPCGNCKKASANCVRANKKFRVKRLITTQNSFKFDPNQTWIRTGNQEQQEPFAIIDESDITTNRSTQEPSSVRDEPQEGYLNFAASILQSFSRDEQVRADDSLRNQPLEPRPTTATRSESNLETSSIGDDTALRKHPSLTPSSTYDVTSVLAYSEPISTRTPLFPTAWQHSPDAASHGPSPSNTESPYSDRHLHYGASSSSATGHRVRRITELAGGSDVQHTSIEEACLVRCFVKKLGRAFDTSDRDHHYCSVLPIRAMHSPLLLNAICTAAARYLTRIWSLKDPHAVIEYDGVPLPNLTMESAIHYHNKCISHLMDVSADPTNTCSDDALTAITILRYHEQVDTHFTGTDNETFSIAVQAVFQAAQDETHGLLTIILQPPRGSDVYATSLSSLRYSACLIALRQEIWGVLIYRRPFRLPIFAVTDYANFDDTMAADDYDWTNRIIIWCAHVLKYCFPGDTDVETIEDTRSRTQQWEALKTFQRNWDEHTPPHFAPLYYQERNPAEGRYFPTIWLASQCQVMAQQHVELARIVLAVHDSKLQLGIGGRAAHKALEKLLRDSTRKICGLAMSNQQYQEAMVTSAVGISMCGEYFRNPREQAAIVELMSILERKHAWPTNTVLGSLQEAWESYSNHDA
ncbi:Zn(2)-C6 fungal-type domain-containing protein [Fusarium keratoplasticum]|uniref:Zn(2)-C6 fungal-type domain-containing protein n=1 Tax=Fusarium keratoplasticum TaxID=1328300 RepID=A0ACC0R5K8_9HYPO|nr:Zn(2)-C6 fungal-type domain-containing protein [Fusarium keratoplasticum]KAI8675625.1 Zn(2)-C6 fungal-type domain-containing protein [Fusarium keratoplasticum]